MTTPHVIAGSLLILAVLLARLVNRTGKPRPPYLDEQTRLRLLGAVTRAYNAE